jgi:2'-5' RNA ligase
MLQKYFIAIVPPEPLLLQIQAIKQSIFENYHAKGALRSPGHITLHMPFSFEESKEEKLLSCLQNFRFDNHFPIALTNYGCFEPRVVFINVQEHPALYGLQKQLVSHVKKHLRLFNQADDMRGFYPHVTVAFRDLKKPVFYKLWDEYQTKPYKADFTCSSFCLLKQGHQNWEVYKEFPLLKSI